MAVHPGHLGGPIGLPSLACCSSKRAASPSLNSSSKPTKHSCVDSLSSKCCCWTDVRHTICLGVGNLMQAELKLDLATSLAEAFNHVDNPGSYYSIDGIPEGWIAGPVACLLVKVLSLH